MIVVDTHQTVAHASGRILKILDMAPPPWVKFPFRGNPKSEIQEIVGSISCHRTEIDKLLPDCLPRPKNSRLNLS